eukprot:3000944-Amphidinium_carterae.1
MPSPESPSTTHNSVASTQQADHSCTTCSLTDACARRQYNQVEPCVFCQDAAACFQHLTPQHKFQVLGVCKLRMTVKWAGSLFL